MPRPVALITGPTSGLGAGYARRFARDGYDLVLVARDVDRLVDLAAELRAAHRIDVEVLPADLSDASDRARVADRLARGVQRQLDVNVTAVMHLTRAALPPMLAAHKGSVINIASVAGLLSGRGSTYSASKAWVVSFSEGLANGLTGTGVGVHAVCPGFVRTEFHQRAGIDMASIPGPLWLSVDNVVNESLADVAKGTVVSIPGIQYKVLTTAGRLAPRRLVRELTKRIGRGRDRT